VRRQCGRHESGALGQWCGSHRFHDRLDIRLSFRAERAARRREAIKARSRASPWSPWSES